MFKEIVIGQFVYRFYKTDHVWTCTVVESQLDETMKLQSVLNQLIDAKMLASDPSGFRRCVDV